MSKFVLGCDLGLTQDHTALALIENLRRPSGRSREEWTGTAYVEEREMWNTYRLHHAERIPLKTSYIDVIKRVGTILHSPDFGDEKPLLVVDATGVGRPVVQLMQQARLAPVPVVITGGIKESVEDDGVWHVPKRLLVSSLAVLYQDDRIKASRQIPFAEELRHELESFRVTLSQKGKDSYEAWREQDHDDLILALGLAAWWGERRWPVTWERVAINVATPRGQELSERAKERQTEERADRQAREELEGFHLLPWER